MVRPIKKKINKELGIRTGYQQLANAYNCVPIIAQFEKEYLGESAGMKENKT